MDARYPLDLDRVYRIPCSCKQVCISSMKYSVKTYIVVKHSWNCQLEKSAFAKHILTP